MSIFNELRTSLEEAVKIQHGRKESARLTRYDISDVKLFCATKSRHSQ